MSEFVGEEIEVRFDKRPGPPSTFTWRSTTYRIAEIEALHTRIDSQKRWWRRRHRDYYVVRAESGEVFRLYFNRGPGRKYWVLQTILDD